MLIPLIIPTELCNNAGTPNENSRKVNNNTTYEAEEMSNDAVGEKGKGGVELVPYSEEASK